MTFMRSSSERDDAEQKHCSQPSDSKQVCPQQTRRAQKTQKTNEPQEE